MLFSILTMLCPFWAEAAPIVSKCESAFSFKAKPRPTGPEVSPAALRSENRVVEDNAKKPTAKSPYPTSTLLEKVYAVHATDFLSGDGVLRPASEFSDQSGFRPAIHFALGQLVQGHEYGNWEGKPYAYVVPLKILEPQLLNLMAHDTFVLGDVKLSNEALLLMPANDPHPNPPNTRVIRYSGALRTAVDQTIKSQGGFTFSLSSGEGTSGDPARVHGQDANTRDFFAPLFERNPRLTYDAHAGTRWGFVDSWLTMGIQGSFLRGRPYVVSTEYLKFERLVAGLHLRALDRFITQFPSESRESYLRARKQIQGYLNIIDADIQMRAQYGKTALENPQLFLADLMNLKDRSDDLKAYLTQKQQSLSEPTGSGGSFGFGFGFIDWPLTSQEAKIVFERFPTIVSGNYEYEGNVERYLLHHAASRTHHIDPHQAEVEGLIKRIVDSTVGRFESARDVREMSEAIGGANGLIQSDYQTDGRRESADREVRRIFYSSPRIKAAVSKYFDVNDLIEHPEKPRILDFVEKQGRNGAWYHDSMKRLWYLKADEIFPESQTAAEVITAGIYRLLGYNVPTNVIVTVDGKRRVASSKIDYGLQPSVDLQEVNTPEFRRLRIFAALLKDWDRVQGGNNNFFYQKRFALIDFGGSLGIRAMGGHKPGAVFSQAIGTFESTPDIKVIFDSYQPDLGSDHPWNHLTIDDYRTAVDQLKGLTDFDIDRIVDKAKYSSSADAVYMKTAIKTRRDGLIRGLEKRLAGKR